MSDWEQRAVDQQHLNLMLATRLREAKEIIRECESPDGFCGEMPDDLRERIQIFLGDLAKEAERDMEAALSEGVGSGEEGHRVEIQFDGDAMWSRLIHPEHGCKPPIDEESGEEIEGEDCWITGWFDEHQHELLHGKITILVQEEWDGDSARLHVAATPAQPVPVPDCQPEKGGEG